MKKLLLLAALALGTAAQAQQNAQGGPNVYFTINDQAFTSGSNYYRLQDTFSFGNVNVGDSIVLDSAYLAAWTDYVSVGPSMVAPRSTYVLDSIRGGQNPFNQNLVAGDIEEATNGTPPLISPSAGERFTLKFKPTVAGTFTETLQVYLTETIYDRSVNPPTTTTVQRTAIMVLRGTATDPTSVVRNVAQPLTLSPNPTKGILSWNTDLPLTSLRIVDMQGREVLQQNNLTEQFINLGHLPNGLYILHGQNEQGRFVQKFVKE